MLDLWQQSADLASRPQANEGGDLPATFGESYDAAWAQGELASSSIKQTNARNAAIAEFSNQIKAAGGDPDGEYASRLTPTGGESMMEPDHLDVANTALAKLKAKNPGVQIAPLSQDDVDKRAVQLSQGSIAAAQQQGGREQSFASRAGSFLGASASSFNDPMNLPLMAIAPEDSVGILGHAFQFGAGAAVSQAANEFINRGYNEQVQPGYGAQGVENVVEAGLGGAALGGGLRALGKVLEGVSTRFWPTATRDAANVVRSEAQIDGSNVLRGIEGEAAHREALGGAIDSVLKGEPVAPRGVDPGIEAHADRIDDLVKPRVSSVRIEREVDESGIARHNIYDTATSEKIATMRADYDPATQDLRINHISGPGFQGDSVNALGPSKVRDALRQLQEMYPEARTVSGFRETGGRSGTAQQDTLATVSLMRSVDGIQSLAGPDMPPEAAQAIADRLAAAKTPEEAQSILNQVSDRPQTLADTMPSQAAFAAANREAAARRAQPPTIPSDQVHELLTAPDAMKAQRADVERAIDAAAKSGKALQIPIGVDAAGEPIMGSATRALTEIDKMNELADQIAQCALPGAEQAAE